LKAMQRLATEMRELGEATGDVLVQVIGYDAEAFACFNLGQFSAGWAYAEKALALYDSADRPSYSKLVPLDQQVMIHLHASYLLACPGTLDQALIQLDASLDEARRLSHPPTLVIALGAAGFSGPWLRLEPTSLLQYADECLALATEHGLGHFRMFALIERGWS